MNTNINKGFQLAKSASEFSDYDKKNIHIGAVIMYKNKVLGVGYNTKKTNPLQLYYNKYREIENGRTFDSERHLPHVHAEMSALLNTSNLNIDWKKAVMYVYRECNGELRNCKPCIACRKALKDRGITKVFYTTENGYNFLDLSIDN